MGERKIEDIISLLKKENSNFKFWKKADSDVIENFETAYSITLPDDFKSFLNYSNGADSVLFAEDAKQLWQKGEYAEVSEIGTSNRILSIEEIIEEYDDLGYKKWKLKEGFKGFYPYIPFFITEENEKIIFVDQSLSKDTPVYLAYHDEPASSWTCIAKNFTDFLHHFIITKGTPPNDFIEDAPNAEEFLPALDNEKRREEKESYKALIKRMTAYLKLFPNNALSFVIRANAYTENGEYEKAFEDFNKSIQLNPKSAFAYNSRGHMLMKLGKHRMALTDMDSACKLKPDDAYYLVGRADAFYELNRMDKALADCNRAIELDETEVLAYMTRYKIYLYQGEAIKAEADSDKIDELLADD